MGNLQARLADLLVPVYQNIQIQGARAIPNAGGAVAAEFPLDAEQAVEQGVRVEFGLQGDHCIEETGLVGETHGLGGVERRAGDDAAQGLEARAAAARVASGSPAGLGMLEPMPM